MSPRLTPLFRLLLHCDRSAPRRVREVMREVDGIDRAREDALLVASELVSSAVLRTGCDPRESIEVEADLVPRGIRIVVTDVGRGTSGGRARDSHDLTLPGALGLRLVGAIARHWGVERRVPRRMWAELAA